MTDEYHVKNNYPPLIVLRDKNLPVRGVTKVGIIPFIPHNDDAGWKFKLMRPQAEFGHPSGSSPDFQVAKGTRRINLGHGWCDMREDDLIHADPVFYEGLVDTALREGEEEIGLKPRNIARLFDVGVYAITSSRRQTKKWLHMFAAEVKDPNDFGEFETKTAQADWMDMPSIISIARADHTAIIQSVFDQLKPAFFAGK